MPQELVVKIVGDASSLNRTFKSSERSAKHFGAEMSKVTRGAAAGSGVFRGLGRSLAFASGGFLAFASAGQFIRSSVDAARDAAVAQRSLGAQMKANNESFKENQDLVERVALSYGKFGFQNDEVVKSLTVLDRATGNINESMKLQGLVAGIARVRNIDLAAAAAVVGKVFGGQETALRRAIPGLSKTAKGMDLIREAQQKLRGQAAANTTAAERFAAILHDTEEIIGTALLPTLNKYLNQLAGWLQKMNQTGELERRVTGFTKTFGQVMGALWKITRAVGVALDDLAGKLGGWAQATQLAIGAWAGFKLAGIVSAQAVAAANLVAAGVVESAWQAALISTGWGALAVAAGLAAAYIITHWEKVKLWFEQFWSDLRIGFLKTLGDIVEPWSHVPGRFGQWARDAKDAIKGPLADARADAARTKAALDALSGPKPPAGARGPITAADVAARAAAQPFKFPTTPATPVKVSLADRLAKQSAHMTELFGIGLDQAGLTKTMGDDLKVLEKLRAYLVTRIGVEKKNLGLRKQLIEVEKQIADIAQQRADARIAARTARQFRILGFGPTGEDLVPGVKTLKRQLASVTDAIEGTFLDTGKTRNRLNNIRRVLAAGVGHISNDVRSKIQQMIADLKAQLRKSSVDVSRFQKTARGQFVLAGAHGAGSGTVVIGNVHLHGIQNLQQLEAALAKRKKQRAHARGGTR